MLPFATGDICLVILLTVYLLMLCVQGQSMILMGFHKINLK